jgi:hypothetical protein
MEPAKQAIDGKRLGAGACGELRACGEKSTIRHFYQAALPLRLDRLRRFSMTVPSFIIETQLLATTRAECLIFSKFDAVQLKKRILTSFQHRAGLR